MANRFISEAITPVVATCDTGRMASGEPGLPGEFLWRDQRIAVANVIRSWRETGPCRNGSRERYVRKHWYEIKTSDHRTMRVYFERQGRGGAPTKRWWLFSVSELRPVTAPSPTRSPR